MSLMSVGWQIRSGQGRASILQTINSVIYTLRHQHIPMEIRRPRVAPDEENLKNVKPTP